MYQTLTFLHNLTRWLVLASLLLAMVSAIRGLARGDRFGPLANAIRHWTATIAHIQLVIGMLLYFRSPAVAFYWAHPESRVDHPELRFFPLLHPVAMLIAVIIISAGSALAKRATAPQPKYRTIIIWYGTALLIILAMIPWPFSPLASRPYWR